MTATEMTHAKELYERKFDAEIREVKARMQLLRAQAATAAVDVRIKIERELEKLEGKKSVLEQRLGEVRAVGAAGWQRLKDGIDAARQELADGLESLAYKLR